MLSEQCHHGLVTLVFGKRSRGIAQFALRIRVGAVLKQESCNLHMLSHYGEVQWAAAHIAFRVNVSPSLQ